jgi:uncharacterized protein
MSRSEIRRIAISGASGFIGSALSRSLRADGLEVIPLVRRQGNAGEIGWDPDLGKIDSAALRGVDAVVHLAGENIAGLWTDAKKRRILESRSRGTRLIAEAMAGLEDGPKTLVSASGVGYYGDGGEQVLREDHRPGDDFLAEVCQAWEAATLPAARAGVRVVNTRSGIVLHPSGGPLALMLPVFKLGIGGTLGSGQQWMSWISLADMVGAIRFALDTPGLSGPVNTTAPDPVRNAGFTRALGRALNRPTIFTVPSFALRLTMREMAEVTLLTSQRAVPAALEAAGYRFQHPSIEAALAWGLDDSRGS